jgi:hypothetical protein
MVDEERHASGAFLPDGGAGALMNKPHALRASLPGWDALCVRVGKDRHAIICFKR